MSIVHYEESYGNYNKEVGKDNEIYFTFELPNKNLIYLPKKSIRKIYATIIDDYCLGYNIRITDEFGTKMDVILNYSSKISLKIDCINRHKDKFHSIVNKNGLEIDWDNMTDEQKDFLDSQMQIMKEKIRKEMEVDFNNLTNDSIEEIIMLELGDEK